MENEMRPGDIIQLWKYEGTCHFCQYHMDIPHMQARFIKEEGEGDIFLILDDIFCEYCANKIVYVVVYPRNADQRRMKKARFN